MRKRFSSDASVIMRVFLKKWNPFQSFHVTSTNENDPKVDDKSCDNATIIYSTFVCHCKNKLKDILMPPQRKVFLD